MSATPRMRSSFPVTPGTNRRSAYATATSTPAPPFKGASVQALTGPRTSQSGQPVIPEAWIEAPQQRFYAFIIWGLLQVWKTTEVIGMDDPEEQSLWLFMKWLFVDATFMFGLPSMRIPWLEWSSTTMLLLFLMHVGLNFTACFQVSAPLALTLGIVSRSVWGAYELAVNEHSVSIQSVLHNDSLILGRQIIHILPEGSAMLNPDKQAFCLDATTTEVRLPLTINSTNPIALDLLRIDLDTQANETIHITKSQIKAMHKDASRMITYSENFHEPKTLYITVKKPGLYSLAKVIDETNLEVSKKRKAHTVIVPCPKAHIESADKDKCRGELSNVNIEVTGTPPLRVKYHKSINQVLHESILDSIQPEDFASPLLKQDTQALVVPNYVETEWARSQQIRVPMSEHLGTTGTWAYTIDEVRDGFGNTIVYTSKDQDHSERHSKAPALHAVIKVHERPVISLDNAAPLKVARGKTAQLPIKLASTGRGAISGASYNFDYLFTPIEEMTQSGEHNSSPRRKSYTVQGNSARPQIKEAGLYSLAKVSTEFCSGDVIEPASILLENPPSPDLTITSEAISDQCAGRPIGLRVDLDLTGTPPFTVKYSVSMRGGRNREPVTERIAGHRGQIWLQPTTAGHYTYRFFEMEDAVYKSHSLKEKELVLEQDVKPSAGAMFTTVKQKTVACIDDQIKLDVSLRGESPFTLEYELLHGGKRQKFEIPNIAGATHSFSTPPLSDGGEYSIALKSIVDSTGCKEFLDDEIKLKVRHQKPKAAFGKIDGQTDIDTLEGKRSQLPLRLVGEAPWTIRYRDSAGREHNHRAEHANDRIDADKEGSYELLEVSDALCPGIVDEKANKFSVKWVPRPEMRMLTNDITERKGNAYVQQPVCEGEESSVELMFKGAAPFAVQYTQAIKPLHGVKSPVNKEMKGLQSMATLRLDTAQPGTYDYKFTHLADANYEHHSKHFSGFNVQQQVFQRPSAAFANAGKTYSFCSVEADGEEVIPVDFQGQPPFELEVEIKSHGAIKPELVTLTGITSTRQSVRIPRNSLHNGKSTVQLRRVSDGRGCSRMIDSTAPRVQIAVFEPPSIFALENSADFCVGEHIQFGLSGQPPFTVFYKFEGQDRKAVVQGTTFRRLAEKPGTFAITGVQDHASSCKASVEIVKHIHGLPSARVSRGKESYVDIHEGGTAELLFEFGGVPPFEFTYQRSANTEKGRKAGAVLDTRSEISDEHSMRIAATEEGTYEIVSIKDRYCAYSRSGSKKGKSEQKRLTY